MVKLMHNHDQQKEHIYQQNKQICQQKDQMKLILKHLNIKSLMLSPTTSTSNADDIEHHADNAKY